MDTKNLYKKKKEKLSKQGNRKKIRKEVKEEKGKEEIEVYLEITLCKKKEK